MATIQQLEAALVKADAAGNTDDARALAAGIRSMRSAPAKDFKPVTVGSAGFGDAVKDEYKNANWADRQLIAASTGMSNMIEGAKQLIPGMKADPTTIQANRAIAQENPGMALAGNVALMAPTAAVPALNTYAGSGVVGGLMGMLQPTLEGESRGVNTALGVGGGVAGKFVGDRLTSALQSSVESGIARQGQNALKDQVLAESKKAGYVLPKSEVSPGFLTDRLESIAGKAALKQDATLRNQQVTNRLGRNLLGLADDQPLSKAAVEKFRNEVSEPYRQVSNLDSRAAAALDALKKVRNEAQVYWNHYNRSADPESMAIAKGLNQKAEMLESVIDKVASSKGQPELLSALRESRKKIAQSYDLERAMNPATGDISAPVVGRLLDKGKPLSDELSTIAKFNKAHPKFSGAGVGTPAPGVSALEAAAMAGFGMAGGMGTDSPMGLLAAGIPLLRTPVRSALLSKPVQGLIQPSYGPGLLTQAGGLVANQLPMAGAYGAIEALR